MIERHLTACLKQALAERNWSQLDGANAAGIHERTLSWIMAGKTSPTLRTLEKIADGWQYSTLFADLGLIK